MRGEIGSHSAESFLGHQECCAGVCAEHPGGERSHLAILGSAQLGADTQIISKAQGNCVV